MSIETAINDSIRESRIVHLHAPIDTCEWVDLATALSVECDDYAETGQIREYWGADDDGDEWRIHLHADDDIPEPSPDQIRRARHRFGGHDV